MRETGIIVKIHEGQLHVHVDQVRPEACAKCRGCEIMGKTGQLILRASSSGNYHTGQKVIVETPEVSPWIGIIYVFGLPVTALVAGLLVGSNWPAWINLVHLEAELAGAALGAFAALATFIIARGVERHYACHVKVHPLQPPPDDKQA